VADGNLRRALPELDDAGRHRVIAGVWENLGRTVGELPHLASLGETSTGPGWEYADRDGMRALAAQGGPLLFVTGHWGNWEVLPRALAALGMEGAVVYRPIGNRVIDAMVHGLRKGAAPGIRLFPKGARGARQAMAHLAQGKMLGILGDQKMNDGIEARFFGLPAMTVSAPAALALRYGSAIVMMRVDRIGPARFRIVMDPPLTVLPTGNRAGDVAAMAQRMNDGFEAWIRARPESWLWLHRRWPKP